MWHEIESYVKIIAANHKSIIFCLYSSRSKLLILTKESQNQFLHNSLSKMYINSYVAIALDFNLKNWIGLICVPGSDGPLSYVHGSPG